MLPGNRPPSGRPPEGVDDRKWHEHDDESRKRESTRLLAPPEGVVNEAQDERQHDRDEDRVKLAMPHGRDHTPARSKDS